MLTEHTMRKGKDHLLSDSSMAWARENLNIASERYRLGVTTFIELRQAEQNLEQTQTTLITARYNMKVAETEIATLKRRFNYASTIDIFI